MFQKTHARFYHSVHEEMKGMKVLFVSKLQFILEVKQKKPLESNGL
jgi:hypothetical protein